MVCSKSDAILKVLVSGCGGRMGKSVTDLCLKSTDFEVVAGVSKHGCAGNVDYPVYSSFCEIKNSCADLIIDFSSKDVLNSLLDYAVEKEIPVVIGTTGYTDEHIDKINKTSKKVPIFFCKNMSLGVNLLIEACKYIAGFLKSNCDIEILEKHHNKKKDAPSGTALMIADGISDSLGRENDEYIFDRTKRYSTRKNGEIGISSIRAGTIIGEHSVIFGMNGENITVTHTAESREIFAKGALLAAKFISKQLPGIYSMSDLCRCEICY